MTKLSDLGLFGLDPPREDSVNREFREAIEQEFQELIESDLGPDHPEVVAWKASLGKPLGLREKNEARLQDMEDQGLFEPDSREMKEFYVIPADRVIGWTEVTVLDCGRFESTVKINGQLPGYLSEGPTGGPYPEDLHAMSQTPVDRHAELVATLGEVRELVRNVLRPGLQGDLEKFEYRLGERHEHLAMRVDCLKKAVHQYGSQALPGGLADLGKVLDERMDEVRQLILDQDPQPLDDIGTKFALERIEGSLKFLEAKLTEPIDNTPAEWTQDIAKAVEASGQREAEYFHLPKKNFKMCGDATKPRWFMDTPVEFTYHLTDLDDVTRNATSGFLSLSSLKPLLTHLGNLQKFYNENKPLEPGQKRKPRLRDRLKATGHRALWSGIGAAGAAAVGVMF